MNLHTATIKCLNNYFNFNGRAKRAEYWYFFAFYLLTFFCIVMLENLFDLNLWWLSTIVGVGYMIPYFAVGARRLHDVGKSGWLQVLPIIFQVLPIIFAWIGDFIPISEAFLIFMSVLFIGSTIYLLFLFICESEKKNNKYGPVPK